MREFYLVIPHRFVLCILIFLGLFNVYTLRNTLAVAIVQMKDEGVIPQTIWGMTSIDVIMTSFFPLYIVANLFGGTIAERYGSKLTFGAGILLTSLITLFIPLASYHGYGALIAVRVFQGIFEGISVPVGYTIYGKWFPKSERSFLRALCEAGFDAGFFIGNPVTGFLCDTKFMGGWPSVFYIFGGFSVLWSALWWLLVYETPAEHPYISEKERNFIITDQGDEVAQQKVATPWWSIMSSPVVWSMIVASMISGTFVAFIRQDYPNYLSKVYGVSIRDVGWKSIMPQILDFVVSIVAGLFGDYLMNHSHPKHRTFIRKAFNVASAVPTAAAQICIIFLNGDVTIITWLMTIAFGLGGLDAVGSAAIPIDISPVFAGSVFGVLNACGNLSMLISPIFIGFITANHEGDRSRWNIIFYIALATNVLSTLIFVVFVSADLQPWGLEGEVYPPCCRQGQDRRRRPYQLRQTRLSRSERIIGPNEPTTCYPEIPLSTIDNMSVLYRKGSQHHPQTSMSTADSANSSCQTDTHHHNPNHHNQSTVSARPSNHHWFQTDAGLHHTSTDSTHHGGHDSSGHIDVGFSFDGDCSGGHH